MASISDKITKTMDGQTPNTTTVSTQRVAGATELQARNLDGWPEDTAVHFTTYRVDSQGEVVDGSEADWMGVVNRNANTIANLTRTDGAPDQGNAVDDVIEPMPTAAWANNLAEGLLECHTTEGKLKEKTVALNNINGGPSAGVLKVDDSGTVTSGKIKASNIDLTSLNKYSTEERVIGQWIDGRPIYRKLITGTVNLGQNSSTDFPHNITGLTNNMRVISCSFAISFGGRLNNGFQSLLPHVEAQHQCGITIINQTIIRLSSSYLWGNSEIAGFIEYVK